jgi:hypothetical protein
MFVLKFWWSKNDENLKEHYGFNEIFKARRGFEKGNLSVLAIFMFRCLATSDKQQKSLKLRRR